MSVIEIKQFTGGLDVRRLPETTPGGVLVKAEDGHINRGGEFEQRAAFVTEYELPAGTVGMAADRAGLVVFGDGTAPTMPPGVRYQQLVHPDGLALTKILSWDLFQSKIYVVAQFEDGSLAHYYDGTLVGDWYDGRAQAQFDVTGGAAGVATPAYGYVQIISGSTPGAATIADLRIGGVPVISAPVAWNTSKSQTATDLAAAINGYASSPDYTAIATGSVVLIRAAVAGAVSNGLPIEVTQGGNMIALTDTELGGGVDNITSKFTDVRVNGVSIISAPVLWAGSDEATALALATEINSAVSSPEYTAVADGATVHIISTTAGSGPNGFKVAVTTANGMTFSPNSGLALAGGADTGGTQAEGGFTVATGAGDATHAATFFPKIGTTALVLSPVNWNLNAATTATDIAAAIAAYSAISGVTASASGAVVTLTTVFDTDVFNGFSPVVTVLNSALTTPIIDIVPMSGGRNDAFTPGTFVRTVRSKMYSTAGGLLHFSAISDPTQWTTDATGAGFIDFSAENSGAEDLVAVARYLNQLVVFSAHVTFVEFIDPDPANNTLSQVLINTGTQAPRSVTQFGDSDVFYLDWSGLRSLRARFASSVAATTDIGVPVDDLISAKLAGMTAEEIANIIGLINPVDKRFWLIMKDQVFVFSFFESAKVSAWTVYNLTQTPEEGGETTAFDVTEAAVFGNRVWVRSADRILSFGGRSGDTAYDYTQAVVWLPMLDANDPSHPKAWTGIDAAVRGGWEIRAAMEPTDQDTADVLVRIYETTYNGMNMPMNHRSTHIGLRFYSTGGEKCILSAATIHFEGAPKADAS